MYTIGVLVGKTPRKDSADDVAEWKSLLTPHELQERVHEKNRGSEPPRLPSDLILLRFLQRAARESRSSLKFTALDSHSLKLVPRSQLLRTFDDFDMILLLTTTFLYESRTRQAYLDFYDLLERTRAVVYPSPEYLRFLFDKTVYLNRLQSAGISIVPTKFWFDRCLRIQKEWSAVQSEFRSYAKDWHSAKLVFKASHSAGKAMVRECDCTRGGVWPELRDWLRFMFCDLNMPGLLVQPYLEAFAAGQEIRTYWIREEFAYALATSALPKLRPLELQTHDGRFHPLVQRLLPIGRDVLAHLPYDGSSPKILVRIDFVDCEGSRSRALPDHALRMLVSEIEMLEACLFPDWATYDVIEVLGQALLEYCLEHSLASV